LHPSQQQIPVQQTRLPPTTRADSDAIFTTVNHDDSHAREGVGLVTRYLLLASEAGLASDAPLLAKQLLLRRELTALVGRHRFPRPRLLCSSPLLCLQDICTG